VAEPGFCNSAVAAVIDECGRVDILINAAGVIVRVPAYETTDQQWRRIFAVNVEGMFYMCRAAILVMRTRNAGAIVNFGSIWGEGGQRWSRSLRGHQGCRSPVGWMEEALWSTGVPGTIGFNPKCDRTTSRRLGFGIARCPHGVRDRPPELKSRRLCVLR